MSSPEPRPLPVAHAERTADPAVLRWVVHEPGLPDVPATLRPPAGTVLADPRLEGLRRAGGDVYVKVADAAQWGQLAPAVDEALREALAGPAAWLFAAGADDECDHEWVVAVHEPTAARASGCSGCSHSSGCGAVAAPVSRRAPRGG